jgi:hypothetical protein
LRVGLGQHRQEASLEQAREHVDVHEEARPAVPMRAPRCFGSVAMASVASADAFMSRP